MLIRKQIDVAFADMAEDSDYQTEARLIAEEFANSDWEAFDIVEKHLVRANRFLTGLE